MKTNEKNQLIIEKNMNKLKKLEEFYVNGTIDDLVPVLNEKKNELIESMIEYANANTVPSKYDREGNPIEYKVDIKPIVINSYFFKSLVPLGSKQPMYNAEKLWLVFDYYMELIAEVNAHIGNFPPTLSGFCKLAGITLSSLRNYKNSSDMDMRTVVEKIYDQIGDDNLTMSQIGMARERSTLFRLKTQNEVVEKVQPNVNITYKEVINRTDLDDKLEKYKEFIK